MIAILQSCIILHICDPDHMGMVAAFLPRLPEASRRSNPIRSMLAHVGVVL